MITADTLAAVPVAAPAAPTLRVGEISDRLGFTVTAAFLGALGFEPVDRSMVFLLYRETDFPHICAALCRHVRAAQAAHTRKEP